MFVGCMFYYLKTILLYLQRIGSMATTSNVYGANVNDSPPVSGQFSRVAVTKSFYNDRSLELAGNNEFLNM